jgi:hypothetical protein
LAAGGPAFAVARPSAAASTRAAELGVAFFLGAAFLAAVAFAGAELTFASVAAPGVAPVESGAGPPAVGVVRFAAGALRGVATLSGGAASVAAASWVGAFAAAEAIFSVVGVAAAGVAFLAGRRCAGVGLAPSGAGGLPLVCRGGGPSPLDDSVAGGAWNNTAGGWRLGVDPAEPADPDPEPCSGGAGGGVNAAFAARGWAAFLSSMPRSLTGRMPVRVH